MKAGAAGRGVSVQTLFVKDYGDSQAAVLNEEFLNRIGEFRHAARVFAFSRIAGPADLAKSMAFLEGGLSFWKIEIAVGIHQRLRFRIQMQSICAAFSSSVIRDKRSLTLRAEGRLAFLYTSAALRLRDASAVCFFMRTTPLCCRLALPQHENIPLLVQNTAHAIERSS